MSLNVAQKHPTDLLVLFLVSEFLFPKTDAQVSELLTKKTSPKCTLGFLLTRVSSQSLRARLDGVGAGSPIVTSSEFLSFSLYMTHLSILPLKITG